MGLDACAYEHVAPHLLGSVGELVDAGGWSEEEIDALYDEYRFLDNPDFPARSDGLQEGFYAVSGGSLCCWSGSYSGYGAWRETLSRTMLGVEARMVWEDPDGYAGAPFVELIHFVDHYGFLGPATCFRLAGDFEYHRDLAVSEGGGRFLKSFEVWAKAFHLAAGTGVVVFR